MFFWLFYLAHITCGPFHMCVHCVKLSQRAKFVEQYRREDHSTPTQYGGQRP